MVLSIVGANVGSLSLMGATTYDKEEPTDSISDRSLEEVVVEAKRETTSATMSTYLPTATVKDASQDAIDLLARMAIPEIRIDPVSKAVKTATGSDISLFINYLPASSDDIQGLRTSDVLKVELLDFPTDPRFHSAEHVINIIVRRYEYGGYTKVSESVFTAGDFTSKSSVYSKFAYRDMVYDLCVAPDYVNTTHVGSSETQVFRLPSGEITRDQRFLEAKFRYIDIPVSFRASYVKENIQIVNTLGFDYFDKLRAGSSGELVFTPRVAGDVRYSRDNPMRTKTLSWNGDYYFAFTQGWSLGVSPSLSYGNNDSRSRYESGIPGEGPIVNNAREKSVFFRMNLKLLKRFGDHHSVYFDPNAAYRREKLTYLGDAPYETVFKDPFLGLGIGYNYASRLFSGGVDGGVCGEFMTVNGRRVNDWYPYLHLNASYSPNDRHRLSTYIQFASNTPGDAERSPNVIQVNELLYRTGNPQVDNSRHWTFYLGYTFLPVNKFSLSASFRFFKLYDRGVDTYELYDGGRAVLRGYDNSGDYTNLQGGVSATLRLLRNSLILQGVVAVNNFRSTGYYDLVRTPVLGQINVSYYWRNFNFTGFYQTRQHFLGSNSGAYSTSRDYYMLRAGWSHGSLNLSVYALNFARRRYDGGWSELVTPAFSSVNTTFNSNYRQCFMVSLTYTVGYGKKVDRGDEVERARAAGSAIMN